MEITSKVTTVIKTQMGKVQKYTPKCSNINVHKTEERVGDVFAVIKAGTNEYGFDLQNPLINMQIGHLIGANLIKMDVPLPKLKNVRFEKDPNKTLACRCVCDHEECDVPTNEKKSGAVVENKDTDSCSGKVSTNKKDKKESKGR